MNFENNENNEITSESGYINSCGDSGSDNNAFVPVTAESGEYPKVVGKENDPAGNRDSAPDMMKSYKSACLKFGFFLTVTLLMRIVAQGLAPAAVRLINSVTSSVDVKYGLSLLYSALFLQVIPSFIAAAMLKYSLKNLAGGFHPPKNSKKAFANFPAVYGAGMTVNLITMALIQLVTHNGNINDSVNSLILSPPSMTSVVVLFVMLVIVAPIFEEFIFRGAVMNLLKPYGSGIAVFVSAFCFAVFHGNFQQFFYAFALGILLGYISYATNSMFCNTVLHAMFNAVSWIIMLFVTTEAVGKKTADPSAVLSDGEQLVLSFYAIFMIAVIVTALIGFIAIIRKLIKIKKYRLPKVWCEIGNGKKLLILIFTVTVLLSILLMTDVMGEGYISDAISGLISELISSR